MQDTTIDYYNSNAKQFIQNTISVEFLDLSSNFKEADLRKGLISTYFSSIGVCSALLHLN